MSRKYTSKSNKWIWIIGWILIFPLPLTILIVRSGINKKVKIGVVAAAWIAYAVFVGTAPKNKNGDNDTAQTTRTVSTQQGGSDKQSNNTDSGKKPSPSPTPSPTPTPVIDVETIELTTETNELGLGDKTLINAKIEPENATDKTLTWESSDESVVSILNNNGWVTAAGGGTATITASSSNGKSASIDISVDGSKRTLNLRVSRMKMDDSNIGDDWYSIYKINGEETRGGEYTLKVGDKINLYAKVVEDDSMPDVGESKKTHTVTEEDLTNGFAVSMNVKVRENAGIYAGSETVWEVIFNFTTDSRR